MSDDAHPPRPDAMVPAAEARVLLCAAPPGKAERLARSLVDEGWAACVNLVPGLRSIYRWKGSVCDDPETLMIVKTSADAVDGLARRLHELHPYEVPELLSLAPVSGLAPYLAWLAGQVTATKPQQ